MLIQHFQSLARYNTLANQRIYEACAQLTEAERQQVRPAFFKSIHGTLNHILLGDRIWLGRFEGTTMPSTGLDAVLYPDFEPLRSARIVEDRRIESFAAGLTEAFLSQTFDYVNNQGQSRADPALVLVAHLFNHQTHHRGQVHDLLTQTIVAPPVLDLHRVLFP